METVILLKLRVKLGLRYSADLYKFKIKPLVIISLLYKHKWFLNDHLSSKQYLIILLYCEILVANKY